MALHSILSGDDMSKFVIGTFLLLGFGFYELSGGADFVPETRPVVAEAVTTTALEPVATRAEPVPVVTLAAVETILPEVVTPVVEAEPVAIAAIERVAEPVIEDPLDLRTVAGSRVNMRAGPGTDFNVIVTVDGGTWTEVLEVNGDGWARIILVDTGEEGWMAERLLNS